MKRLISDITEIEQLTKTFQILDNEVSNWKKMFNDKSSGDTWLLFNVDTELQGNGYPIFAKLPMPDSKQLIEIAISTKFEDELFAACRVLTENEKVEQEEFRSLLIGQLEKITDKKRQKRIIELTGLDSRLNRKEILGKSIEQVASDSNYFKEIADRAHRLKQNG